MITYKQDHWTVSEDAFDATKLGKCEVIMALGNGYMGIRSATEENYLRQTRNTFVAGTFNKANPFEVTELPNIPDFIEIELMFNNQRFTLTEGTIHHYERTLDLRSGELKRTILWEHEACGKLEIIFNRFVSQNDRHLVMQEVVIRPLTGDVELDIKSGINGQMTNSGSQHFIEGEKRFFDKKILAMEVESSQSNIGIYLHNMHTLKIDDEQSIPWMSVEMDRRKIVAHMKETVKKERVCRLTKYTVVATTRDLEFAQHIEKNEDGLILIDLPDGRTQKERKNMIQTTLNDKLNAYERMSYDSLMASSEQTWQESLWKQVPILIESEDPMDIIAARFAQYHLHIMTPAHDVRMGIGAKGMTGEGYKGHSFWDTEIFMFPYFLYTQPSIAKRLLIYRYTTLEGARKKAIDNGYSGAMFPWESAWQEDGEVTPVWGACDIVTGEATKIWSGFIEQHITADIAFAIYQYYAMTKDQDFMVKYGYEMLFETAVFWSSRLEPGEDGLYHINNVVGPDEYKEHVDDNAFTNYLVKLNFELAMEFVAHLETEDKACYQRLNTRLQFSKCLIDWEEKSSKLFLPKPNSDHIIGQDSTYLSKEMIDLTKYKNREQVGTLFKEYNLEQVNNIQVSKQADIMLLFYLMEGEFTKEVKLANWDYYEPKTLHDSSLSLSTHAIIANDLGHEALAYELYTKCRNIDIGPNMSSSDHGIHAASLGGMLQAVINGFGGVRLVNGNLRIEPKLPKQWKKVSFPLHYKGDTLHIEIDQHALTVTNKTRRNTVIEFNAFGAKYLVTERISISLNNQM